MADNLANLFDTRIRRVLEINSYSFSSSDEQTDTSHRFTQQPFGSAEGQYSYNTDDTINAYMRRVDQIGDDENDDLTSKLRKHQQEVINAASTNTRIYKGTASLMNPYSVTRLYGADGGEFLVDRYNARKWYEMDGNNAGHYAADPTTSNIIKWGSGDRYGRTPYSYQDFVFCKHWNIIPNNRMITLRRYMHPTYDNLNFTGMDENKVSMHPVATAVTYFGEGTENTLSDIIKFSAGIPWDDVKGEVWEVTGQAPTMEVMNKATGWDKFANSPMVNAATISGLLGAHNAFGNSNFDKDATKGLPDDPYKSGQYTNRILGPVNQINTMKRRAIEGNNQAKQLDFKMDGLEITFNYVARPISGINQKAALLDMMANMLVMCYASAVFFGGMHRFMIDPVQYPFNDEPARKALHEGRILGDDGAAALWVRNFKKKMTDGMGGDSAGNVFSLVGGTMANMLGKGFETLLGKNGLSDWLKGTDAAKSDAAQNASKNLEDQIASTIQGRIGTINFLKNMRAVLSGEPVGDWHLVVGNPMNPIVEIGNLVCSNIDFKFSDELGPDDFPIGFTAKVKLDHGMPRDRDGIEAMFNRGAGRIYNLPDKYSSSGDGQTSVDDFTKTKGTGAFRWTTGYQTPAKTRNGTNGTTDEKAHYDDAYKTVGFQTPNIDNTVNIKNLFYKNDMSGVVHHIMPWQTKIVM